MNIKATDCLRHFIVVADISHFPENAYKCALQFAKGYEKNVSFLIYNKNTTIEPILEKYWDEKIEILQKESSILINYSFFDSQLSELIAFTEEAETPMLFFEIHKKSVFNKPLNLFKQLKELRIPFIFTKDWKNYTVDFSKIIVPIGFLAEEKEKAPYSCNMGRFMNSKIYIYQAKDYGTKTPKNVASVVNLYNQFNIDTSVILGKKDSFEIEKEATTKAQEINAGMVLVSTSRDYGLDDIIFGPKELQSFNKASCPIMFINPRSDLYVLCW